MGERYTDLHKVGEGTFGVVYRARFRFPVSQHPPDTMSAAHTVDRSARDKETGQLVAIKRIKLQTQHGHQCPGVEISALDEIRLLFVGTPTMHSSFVLSPLPELTFMVPDATQRVISADLACGSNWNRLHQELHHPNIVSLREVFSHRAGVISLVQDFLPMDLEHIINAKDMTKKPYVPMPHEDIKSYLRMMLAGIACCHANFVLHRDLKVRLFLSHE